MNIFFKYKNMEKYYYEAIVENKWKEYKSIIKSDRIIGEDDYWLLIKDAAFKIENNEKFSDYEVTNLLELCESVYNLRKNTWDFVKLIIIGDKFARE